MRERSGRTCPRPDWRDDARRPGRRRDSRADAGPMLRYLFYRVASIVPVLLGVSVVVFLMMKLVPGDPAEAILGPAASTDKIEMLRRSLGLDRPFYVESFRWLLT